MEELVILTLYKPLQNGFKRIKYFCKKQEKSETIYLCETFSLTPVLLFLHDIISLFSGMTGIHSTCAIGKTLLCTMIRSRRWASRVTSQKPEQGVGSGKCLVSYIDKSSERRQGAGMISGGAFGLD